MVVSHNLTEPTVSGLDGSVSLTGVLLLGRRCHVRGPQETTNSRAAYSCSAPVSYESYGKACECALKGRGISYNS